MMRRLGQLLMFLGLGLGGAVGIAILAHLSLPGVSWLVAVGLAKLTLVAAGGLLTGGAILQRLAARREHVGQLPPSSDRPNEPRS